jgi:hypothetical protein
MEALTWIDRITDESNPWFVANKMEDERDFASAITFYLKDATDCLKRDLKAKAALSSSCAADCLAEMGQIHYAHRLYAESARTYLSNAESKIGTSVREALWSLREAFEHYQLAEDLGAAGQVRQRLIRLARRVDPNAAERGLPSASLGGEGKLDRRRATAAVMDIPPGVRESIDLYLLTGCSEPQPKTAPEDLRERTVRKRRDLNYENSIAGQLG